MRNGNIFVWLQHGHKRDAAKTVTSIQQSDIGTRYTCITDPNPWTFPEDYPKLQAWWEDQMLRTAALALDLGCEFVLRLEDDVLVNRHILHNLKSWPALQDPTFGMGTLFVPNRWKHTPWILKPSEYSSGYYYDSPDVEGAQGQVYRAADMAYIVPTTRKSREERGLAGPLDCVSFDWALSRAFHNSPRPCGQHLRTFVHVPALVDIHDGSCSSLLSGAQDPEFHYWGFSSFNLDWRRV